jgi:uncharacterized RDD family membrane protein YckC
MLRKVAENRDDACMSNSLLSRVSISAGPLRRLGAMFYDLLLIVALQIVATLPFLPFLQDRVLVASEAGWLAYAYRLWQLALVILFFGFFWTRKGRTLGMQAWRLRMLTTEGALPSWRDALQRLMLATVPWLPAFAVLTAADYLQPRAALLWIGGVLLALGFANYFIAWLDPERRSWHDRFLRTRVIRDM